MTHFEKLSFCSGGNKGETCTVISRKHEIWKQTFSGWIKDKSKIYDEAEKNRTRKDRA